MISNARTVRKVQPVRSRNRNTECSDFIRNTMNSKNISTKTKNLKNRNHIPPIIGVSPHSERIRTSFNEFGKSKE